MTTPIYFSGQGKVYAADRDSSGNPAGFKYMGNVPELTVNLAVSEVEHHESTSGQRLKDAIIQSSKDVTVAFTLEEFTADLIALALYGQKATVTGTTVTAESLVSTGLVLNDFFRTKNPDISSVAVKDSAGTPATLTPGTDYQVVSAKHGTLQILALGTYVQPFKVDYTFATYVNVPMFAQPFKERVLRFDGLNTANGNKECVIEIYRVVISPMKDWALLNDAFASWKVEGKALYDATRAADSVLGGFGRVVFIS